MTNLPNPIIQCPYLPVILLTARLQIIGRLEFSQLPIAGVIRKPFKATTLIQEMRSILNWYSWL